MPLGRVFSVRKRTSRKVILHCLPDISEDSLDAAAAAQQQQEEGESMAAGGTTSPPFIIVSQGGREGRVCVCVCVCVRVLYV